MKSAFHKFCYSIAYPLAIVVYFVVAVLFTAVALVLYAIWWVYEPLARALKGE